MTDKKSQITERGTVFSTNWFNIVAKKQVNSEFPYFVVEGPDCVTVLAVTKEKKILLVKQFRPTIEQDSTELPSGHIEKDEEPEQAAIRELFEETGYKGLAPLLIGVLATDSGRLGNRLWCYFIKDAEKLKGYDVHEISELMLCDKEELYQKITSGEIIHSQDIAVVFLASQKELI
jgi:ADP-ribose pyrophosphatase